MNKIRKINSIWTVEKGRWVPATNSYINRFEETFERTLTMRKEMRSGREVLVFQGGPTGFESYYISDLLEEGMRGDDFCICAGTINSWPKCTVKAKEVFDYIQEEK